MIYENLNIEDEVNRVVSAVEPGNFRSTTKRKSMTIRLAALSDIVHEMQVLVKSDKKFADNTAVSI